MEKGWIWEHPAYGTWFISRQSVIEDWKQDHLREYGDAREPDEDEVQTWYDEQTTWIEVSAYGKQTKEADMDYWKIKFLEEMKHNYECDLDAVEVG